MKADLTMTKKLMAAVIGVIFLHLSGALSEAKGFAAENKSRIAIFPFSSREVPSDSVMQLRLKLAQALNSTGQFDVMSIEVMHSYLKEAGYTELEKCTLPPCVANFGKILGVERILYGEVNKGNPGYDLQVRVVHVEKGELIFEKLFHHSRSFDKFLAEIPLEVALALEKAEESLRGKKRLYLVGAVLVGIGASIYFLSKALGFDGKRVPTPDNGDPPPPVGD